MLIAVIVFVGLLFLFPLDFIFVALSVIFRFQTLVHSLAVLHTLFSILSIITSPASIIILILLFGVCFNFYFLALLHV